MLKWTNLLVRILHILIKNKIEDGENTKKKYIYIRILLINEWIYIQTFERSFITR